MASLWDNLTDQYGGGSELPTPTGLWGEAIHSYLSDVFSGRKAYQGLEALQPVQPYTPGQSLASMALDPQAQEQAQNVALSLGLGNIRAYHGSPHDFGAFDTAKIGTGEGAQAYGHGMYFAETEPVAQSYRENLSNLQLHVNGEKVGEVGALGTDPTANAAYAIFALDGMPLWAKNYVRQSMERHAEGNYGFNQETGNAVLKAIDDIGSAKVEARPGGKMYEVDIKAEPEDFLQWDKPLSEQSQGVQKAFGGIVDRDLSQETGWAKLTGEEAYRAVVERAGIRGGGEAALREAGIPGIRYLDQGSRGAGEGTHNYVVFDPKTIEIIRKYGIPGLLGGGAAAGAATDGGS